jgi:hypothetical protein
LCIEGNFTISQLEGIEISKLDSVLPVWEKVPKNDRRLLVDILKRRTSSNRWHAVSGRALREWARRQQTRERADVDELARMTEAPLSEVKISQRTLDKYAHLLSKYGIQFFDQQWGLGEEKDTLDLVGKNKDGNLLALIELKRDPVGTPAIGQTLMYQNFAREARETGELRYSKGKGPSLRYYAYPLAGILDIRAGIVGSYFKDSAYFAGKGTDLTYYLVDEEFTQVIHSLALENATKAEWRKFKGERAG